MSLAARYRQIVLGFVGLLIWLVLFDTREANLADLNSLMSLLFLAIPVSAVVKATLQGVEQLKDLGPTLLTVLGLSLLMAIHYVNLV